MNSSTTGLDHLGLSVKDLDLSVDFFTKCLGWTESGRDDSYPRAAVSDGTVRLTLWQVDRELAVEDFNRRKNIGLHHVAFKVESEQALLSMLENVKQHDGVTIEFEPELVGAGPRKHMMCTEPGGIRIEFIWSGE